MTQHDIDHTEHNPTFVKCEIPRITNFTISNINSDVSVTWVYSSGCVTNITVDYYRFCWTFRPDVIFPTGSGREEDCTHPDGGQSEETLGLPGMLDVELDTVEIRPNDIVYGGLWGFESLLGNKWFEALLDNRGGAYYPEQRLTSIDGDES